MIREIDKTKDYKNGEFYHGMIFDDMNFSKLERETQIHIVDRYFDSQVKCRYADADIPKGCPVIITTNLAPGQILEMVDEAISRRCVAVEFVSIDQMKVDK